MKPKRSVRMQILADGGGVALADPPAAEPTAAPEAGRFHGVAIVEDVMTGDKRIFAPGALTWRDLPVPLMGHDETQPEHLGAILLGNVDRFERRGNEIHYWGAYLSAPDTEAAQLISQVQSGELRGVSVDIDMVEFELLIAQTDANGDPLVDPFMGMLMMFDDEEGDGGEDTGPETEVLPDGIEYEVVPIPQDVLRVTEGRIMAVTVEPLPAFQEAFIEDGDGEGEALVASAQPYRMLYRATEAANRLITGFMLQPSLGAVTAAADPHGARFQFPVCPPREWFEIPEADEPTPLTITDNGQVFGHLAIWGECHVGIAGECVEPPASPSNYARFHVGEIPVDDGGRVAVGHLTFARGHADMALGAEAARRHYDDTCTAAADIRASDGDWGVWVCGAARPDLSAADVRTIMSAPPSGDWRRFGADLEMVGALCVNVPGFNVPRAQVRREAGLVASLIVSHPAPRHDMQSILAGADPVFARKVADRIAQSIGRDTKSRIAELRSRVHAGGK